MEKDDIALIATAFFNEVVERLVKEFNEGKQLRPRVFMAEFDYESRQVHADDMAGSEMFFSSAVGKALLGSLIEQAFAGAPDDLTIGFLTACEAWVSVGQPGESRPNVFPSEDPNRREALSFTLAIRGMPALSHMLLLDEKTREVQFQPFDASSLDATFSWSRFSGEKARRETLH